MRNSKLFISITCAFILSGCETYLDCVEKAVSADKSAKKQLHKICIMKHEKELQYIKLNQLDGKASLKSEYGEENIYQFRPKIKNNNDNTIITQVSFTVTIKQDGQSKSLNFTGKTLIEPTKSDTFYFNDLMEKIELPRSFNKKSGDDWTWNISSAKGVQLR